MNESDICLNCKSQLNGDYCSLCGQKNINPNNTIGELINEFFEEFFSLDNRLFHTLKSLVFSPGKMTIDYNAGKRVKYTPLLKSYIFVSFALFLIMTFGNNQIINFNIGDDIEKIKQENEVLKKVINEDKKVGKNLNSFFKWLAQKKRASGKNDDYIKKEVINRFPQVMFFIMPFLALLLKVFFFRVDKYYTHHLVYSIHVHTFAFIVLSIISLLGLFEIKLLEQIGAFFSLTIPWYFYKGLKNQFHQSGIRTLIKTVMIGFLYWLMLIISLILLILFSLIVF